MEITSYAKTYAPTSLISYYHLEDDNWALKCNRYGVIKENIRYRITQQKMNGNLKKIAEYQEDQFTIFVLHLMNEKVHNSLLKQFGKDELLAPTSTPTPVPTPIDLSDEFDDTDKPMSRRSQEIQALYEDMYSDCFDEQVDNDLLKAEAESYDSNQEENYGDLKSLLNGTTKAGDGGIPNQAEIKAYEEATAPNDTARHAKQILNILRNHPRTFRKVKVEMILQKKVEFVSNPQILMQMAVLIAKNPVILNEDDLFLSHKVFEEILDVLAS